MWTGVPSSPPSTISVTLIEVEDKAFESCEEDGLKSIRLSKRYLDNFIIYITQVNCTAIKDRLCIFKLQMKAGMRYICGGKVHEAADCKGRVVPLGEKKIKQTVDVLRIDFEKPQV